MPFANWANVSWNICCFIDAVWVKLVLFSSCAGLQELIQNADDAGATEVRFLIDSRSHSTDCLINDGYERFQGPALYAWNNAVFKKCDWDSLAKIDSSSKQDDALKIGRFGLGFLSIFHISGKLLSSVEYVPSTYGQDTRYVWASNTGELIIHMRV